MGVRQVCILRSNLINIYGNWIMRDATIEWTDGVTIDVRKICNLRYADDATILANHELNVSVLLKNIKSIRPVTK